MTSNEMDLMASIVVDLQNSDVNVEILNTEEANENDIKYLNINVSDDEVKRNPDIVRLCSDAGILEYVKQKTGHWIHFAISDVCSECGWSTGKYISPSKYCPDCGVKMSEMMSEILIDSENEVQE